MVLLNREEIFKRQDGTFKDVAVPEWGGKVRIKSMTGAERDAFEEWILGEKKKDGSREVVTANLRAKLIALTATDKDGKLLFSKDDVTALGDKNAAALDRLFAVAQKLAGISKDDVEDMVKNSGTAQAEEQPSA